MVFQLSKYAALICVACCLTAGCDFYTWNEAEVQDLLNDYYTSCLDRNIDSFQCTGNQFDTVPIYTYDDYSSYQVRAIYFCTNRRDTYYHELRNAWESDQDTGFQFDTFSCIENLVESTTYSNECISRVLNETMCSEDTGVLITRSCNLYVDNPQFLSPYCLTN